jgi:hypothetical protein
LLKNYSTAPGIDQNELFGLEFDILLLNYGLLIWSEKIEIVDFCGMVKHEKELQMKPVQKLHAVCLAAALLVFPSVVSAQAASEPLPVLAFSDDPVIESQTIIVAAPVPPARPSFEARRSVRVVAANRSTASRRVVASPARVRPVEPVRVAMVRTFWMTVGNGF